MSVSITCDNCHNFLGYGRELPIDVHCSECGENTYNDYGYTDEDEGIDKEEDTVSLSQPEPTPIHYIPNMKKLQMIKQILNMRKINLEADIYVSGAFPDLVDELEVRKELLDYINVLIDIEQDYPILGIQKLNNN